LYFTAL